MESKEDQAPTVQLGSTLSMLYPIQDAQLPYTIGVHANSRLFMTYRA